MLNTQTVNLVAILLTGSLGAVLGAIASGIASYRVEKLKIKNIGYVEKKQAYSRLWGRKHLVSQSRASYFSAFIQSQIYDANICLRATLDKRGGKSTDEMEQNLKDSSVYQQIMRVTQRYENLQLKLADDNCRMWETIGQIQILFPANTEVDKLIDQIRLIEKNFSEFERTIIKEVESFISTLIPESEFPSTYKLDEWGATKSNELDKLYDIKISDLVKMIEELDDTMDEVLKIIKLEMDNCV